MTSTQTSSVYRDRARSRKVAIAVAAIRSHEREHGHVDSDDVHELERITRIAIADNAELYHRIVDALDACRAQATGDPFAELS